MAFSLAASSTPPTNYIGTVLFISYIVAALELTNFIVTHLFSLYESRTSRLPLSKQPEISHIIIFSSLAALSFAVLSNHMLSFLIQSYTGWCESNGYGLAIAIRDIMPKLWAWMTDSMLFTTFAHDLVGRANGEEWIWAGMALAGTMAWGNWMATSGHQRAVPHLWAYFLLGQILPIAFTQNLFFIALLCLPKEQPESQKAEGTGSAVAVTASPMSVSLLRMSNFVVLFLFIVALLFLPSARNEPWFMDLVLVTRLLLFAPYLIHGADGSAGGGSRSNPLSAVVGGMLGGALYLGVLKFSMQDGKGFADVLASARSNPAIRALVDDMVIGTVSAGFWTGLGLHRHY